MRYSVIIWLVLLVTHISYSQTNSPLIKIVASDREDRGQFGWSTSVFGNYCVVGTSQKKFKTKNYTFKECGEVYIFNKQTDNTWLQTQQLLPDTPKSLDFYGGCVSIYENYLAVGANGDDNGIDKTDRADNRQGAVYMYKLDESGKWNKTQKIILKNRPVYDCFGERVCLFKKKLAISSHQNCFPGNNLNGKVYIYEQNFTGDWVSADTIVCPEKDISLFGMSVSLSDSVLVVGSMDGKDVFVYKLSKTGRWNLLSKLSATDTSDFKFGSSVYIYNNTICVGAEGSFDYYDGSNKAYNLEFRKKNLLGAGSVYIYEIDTINKINFKQRITAKDIKADQHFGICSSLTDSLLVVGAFGDALDDPKLANNVYGGAAYIFKKNKDGKWIETKKIVSPKRAVWDKFAFSVSAYKKTVIIGSRFDKEDVQEKNPLREAGSAYIYEDK